MRKILSAFLILGMLMGIVPCFSFAQTENVQSTNEISVAHLPDDYVSYFDGVDLNQLLEGDTEQEEKIKANMGYMTDANCLCCLDKPMSRDLENPYFWWFRLEKGLKYDEHDFNKMQVFFETVADNGRKNGLQLSSSYDKNEPATWAGTCWEKGKDDVYYLRAVMIDKETLYAAWSYSVPAGNFCLGGALDLADMTCLESVWSRYNKFEYADFTNCKNLRIIWNRVDTYNDDVRLSGCVNLETLIITQSDLTSIDITKKPKLYQISFEYNDISSLDFSDCHDVLEALELTNCKFAELDVSNMPKLTILNVNNNMLTQLDVSHNSELNMLSCSGNKISFLDLSKHSKLSRLEANNCDLRTLLMPKGGNYERGFSVANNKITELDLSGVTGLSGLNCDNNYLTELDVSDCENLHGFVARNNLLKSIKFGANPFLQSITLSNNLLTKLEIPRSAVNFNRLLCDNNCLTELDLSGFYALWYLDCHNNNIKKLDLAKISATLDELANSLTCFDCTGNPTEELVNIPYAITREAEGRYNLLSEGGGYAVARTERKLNSDGVYKPVKHYITAEPADGCSFLGWYEGDKCVSTDADILVSYYHGTGAPGTNIECHFEYSELTAKFTGEKPQGYTGRYEEVPDEHMPTQNRISEGCAFNEKDVALVRDFLEYADESGKKNGEKLMSVYDAEKPESWTCCFWVEREGDAQLEALFLDNQLDNDTGKYVTEGRYTLAGTLNMKDAEHLKYVYLYGSEITSVDFTGCSSLTHIYAGKNGILSDVKLSGCDSLQLLDLQGCNLAEIDLSGKNELAHLNITDNSFNALDLSLLPGLTWLNCAGNNIAELDMEKVPSLHSLHCENNRIKELDVHMCSDLAELDCSANGMEKLETIQGFLGENNYAHIQILHCSDNALQSLYIPPTAYICTAENNSISTLNKNNTLRDGCLLYFSIAHNKLTELSFIDEIYLISLDCSYNELEKLDFVNQYQLTVLDCSHNHLEKNALPTSYTQSIRIVYYDCSYNNISEIDLAKCGNLTHYLNISDNPVTSVKNAPLGYIIRQAIWLGDKNFYRINIKTQGTGYIDYDLDTITAIGEDLTGFYANGTKLTNEKTLSTDGMESCNILVRFGDFPIGDVNGNGTVNTGDAVVILKHSAEMVTLSKEQKELADVNGDDTVNTGDAVLILKFAAGMITEF